MFIFWREKQSAISGANGNITLRTDFKFEMHPECAKRLIIGIIRTVTEAYESHQLLADLLYQAFI